ncbi:MAG: helix-hairpin-helix domain-containing protein [Myxococcales bacterium]|nr:helix-hairpin-helix domain-containing protein [Myxococcales bacterium]
MSQLIPPTGVASVRVRGALIAALAAVGFAALIAAASAPPATAATTGVVNVNTASALELERLPGIGESKAKAIVAHREDHGAYQQVEDLLEVKGIGDGALERIRKLVVIEGATTLR